MGKPKTEIWKPVPVKIYDKTHEISNWGRIRSVTRTIEKLTRWGTKYKMNVGGHIRIHQERGTGINWKVRFMDVY